MDAYLFILFQITAFFEEITVSGKKYTDDITTAYRIVHKVRMYNTYNYSCLHS